jgi:hypothetical protein
MPADFIFTRKAAERERFEKKIALLKRNAIPVPELAEGTQRWRNNPEKDPSAGSGSGFWRFRKLVSTKHVQR